MQVDLFNNTLLSRAKRQIGQISTRGYEMATRERNMERMQKYFSSEEDFKNYRNYIRALIKEGRHYDTLGFARSDSLFDVESLGIANNGQNFMMIADFSYSLDYIMHRLCGCKLEDIRAIKDYDRISKAVMNYDIDSISDIPLARLISASDKVEKYLVDIVKRSNSMDIVEEDKLSWVAYTFYKDIISLAGYIKFYTTVVVCDSFLNLFGKKGVIRSTSFSKIAATVDQRFDDIITIHDTENAQIEDYDIVYRSYGAYEYLGEVITLNEFSR